MNRSKVRNKEGSIEARKEGRRQRGNKGNKEGSEEAEK